MCADISFSVISFFFFFFFVELISNSCPKENVAYLLESHPPTVREFPLSSSSPLPRCTWMVRINRTKVTQSYPRGQVKFLYSIKAANHSKVLEPKVVEGYAASTVTYAQFHFYLNTSVFPLSLSTKCFCLMLHY